MSGEVFPVAAGTLILMLLLARSLCRLHRPRPSPIDHPAVFLPLVCVAILALRWNQITLKSEMQVDESQMLAQAMRFLSHPVPWRDVDGTTSGPLNSMLLCVPLMLGAPAAFETARFVLLALVCLTVIFLYLALRTWGSRADAQLVLMPTIFYYGFSYMKDFVHYTSTSLPVFLLSVDAYLLSRDWKEGRISNLRLFLVGLIAGIVPFAKLQAAPLGMFPFAVEAAHIFVRSRQQGRAWGWLKPAGLLCLGGIIAPVLVLGPVMHAGALGDFWQSYIRAGAEYSHVSRLKSLQLLVHAFAQQSDANSYVITGIGGVALLALLAVHRERGWNRELILPMVLLALYAALTLFCIYFPAKGFNHYLNLLVPVIALHLGFVLLQGRWKFGGQETPAPAASRTAVMWFLLFSAILLRFQTYDAELYHENFRNTVLTRKPWKMPEVARIVRDVAEPGDTLAIWGWSPAYYVETGLLPATRDAIGHYQMTRHPLSDYFRQRFLNDLKQSRPAIFVDSVARGEFLPQWTESFPHEDFAELNAYLDAHYRLYKEVQLARRAKPVRIYLLNERWAKVTEGREKSNYSASKAGSRQAGDGEIR